MTAFPFYGRNAVLLVLAMISGASVPAAEKVSVERGGSDKDKLQGKWRVMSISMQGQVVKREDAPEGWKNVFDKDVTVEGDKFIHAQPDGGRFQLDDARKPKQITFPDKDGVLNFQGIYAIDGDDLTLCVNGDGKAVLRPKEFTTKEGTPLVLVTLKKIPTKK
ncbi:MAG: TIGR03067 domain-containing protein [Planctomycetia bacterium]